MALPRGDAAQHQFDDDFIYQEIPKPPLQRNLPTEQLHRDEAYEVFKEGDKNPDKIRYYTFNLG